MTEYSNKQLRKKCDEYFDNCDFENRLYSESGLGLYLKVPIRTLRAWYRNTSDIFDNDEEVVEKKEERQEIIELAYMRIQEQYETKAPFVKTDMSARAAQYLDKFYFGGMEL